MKPLINLKKLTKILKNHSFIIAAYLIGSIAQKRDRKDSDLDLILLVDKNFKPERFGTLYRKISVLVSHPNLDLRIARLEDTDPLFLFQILGGRLLFARNTKELVKTEVKIMKLYYDSQHLRNIFHYYLNKRLEKGIYGR